jgi:hypothetical protein
VGHACQGVEEDELGHEQDKVDDIDDRFWVGWMEEGCEVRGWDAGLFHWRLLGSTGTDARSFCSSAVSRVPRSFEVHS